MQSIYAFKQSRHSNYQLALDQIAETYHNEFMNDDEFEKELAELKKQRPKNKKLNREELLNYNEEIKQKDEQLSQLSELMQKKKERLDAEKAQSVQQFEKAHKHEGVIRIAESVPKTEKVGLNAVRYYQKLVGKDLRTIKASMLTEAEHTFVKYLKILQFLIEVADYSKVEFEKRNGVEEKLLYHYLFDNKIIQLLRTNVELQRNLQRFNIKNNFDTVRKWYRILANQEAFFEYVNDDEVEVAEHLRPTRFIIRDFIFKNDVVLSSFEEDDLKWVENRAVLKSMLLKTLKNINDADNEFAELLPIAKNWEDDKLFFQQLFEFYLKDEDYYEQIVGEKASLWSKERIASLDMILMGMATSEMINFQSIPTKVTINEYLEISKIYSTPKSWQFINGILDKISVELVSQGKIKKSGRGLLN